MTGNRLSTALVAAAIAVMAWLVATPRASAAPVTAEATLRDNRISTDEAAVLELSVSGSGSIRVQLPEVENLEFQAAGQSSSFRSINGRMTSSLTQRYRIYATEPGDYEIPPITVISGSDQARTKTLRLAVSQGSGRRPAGAPALAPPSGFDADTPAPDAEGQIAFLKVQPAKTSAFVGELVPVEVKAYFRDGIRMQLRSLPNVEGGSFTLTSQEGDAPKSREVIDGVSYTVLTVYSALAATKPGAIPLEVDLDVVAMIPQEREQRQPRSRSTIDRFFGDIFGPRTTPKELTITADPIVLDIKELPSAEKPTGFSGAVGQFSLTAETSAQESRTGEPVSVKLQVVGKGNFDRVAAPELSDSDDWKSYPPTGRFSPADSIGQTGVKTFDATIAPQAPEITEIPPFDFVYFDPEIERYTTTSSDPIPLEVSGPAPAPEIATADGVPEPDAPAEVAPIDDRIGLLRAPRPFYRSTWFIATNGASLAALAIAVVTLVRRSRGTDLEAELRARQREAIENENKAMDKAISEGDATAFFRAARRVLQLGIAAESGASADAITGTDTDDPVASELFSVADTIEFSGSPMTTEELREWRTRLESFTQKP